MARPRSRAGTLHAAFAVGAAAGAPDQALSIACNPAVSERQRRYMGAELRRLREGRATHTGMNEKQLREYAAK